MNVTALRWPVEFGSEDNRGRLKDLVRASQLGQLTLEPLDLGVLLTAHPDLRTGIHLGLAHPAAQRLRRPDTQLGSDRLDRGPLRAIAGASLGDHPDRTLPQLRRIFRSSHAQDPIAFSTDGASGHAGG